MARRQDSLDRRGRVGEATWYGADGRELVRVPFRYASSLGPGDTSLIVSSVTCRTADEIAELRAAIIEACDAAAEHIEQQRRVEWRQEPAA